MISEKQLKVMTGALLHDVGKVIYRTSDHRNHSESGYDFLKNEMKIEDDDILDQVRYHHASNLRNADIPDDSLAYITYMADNIASAADRRVKENGQHGFDQKMPLDSLFNILNGNHQNYVYQRKLLDYKEGINYPTNEEVKFDDSYYKKVKRNLSDVLDVVANNKNEDKYINSLLEVLEGNLSFIPSSTSKNELADISLYDHVKITAAVASCILVYLETNGIRNWKKELFTDGQAFHDKKVFLLFSMDMSGIQSFIYTQFDTDDALKNLRSRSFYLDMLMENSVDDLLDELGLARTNLIYSGGGHAYLLLPNTEDIIHKIEGYCKDFNTWLVDEFRTDLFMGYGYTPCSSNDLQNKPDGSYRQLFRNVSQQISQKKVHRYTPAELIALNKKTDSDHDRECRVCHRSDHLLEDDLCEICAGLIYISAQLTKSERFFTVLSKGERGKTLPLAKDRYLTIDQDEKLRWRMENQEEYVRSYSKNEMYAGYSVVTKLWMGDYSSSKFLSEIDEKNIGINRLGVLRADVDNLGQAFVAGFDTKYQTLSRAAAFSRKLSLFFKLYINHILKNGQYSLDGKVSERNAIVIYSGGDDIFVVGAWKDILEFAVDLHNALKKFTQNTLTISAGFGLFYPKYPISYMARQTGDLVDCAKQMDGKNAIALFDENNVYHWNTFIEQVLGEKFKIIKEFFESQKNLKPDNQERGKAFLYNILDLFRNRKEKINLARLAYTLSRLQPSDDDAEGLEMYRNFSLKLYEWMKSDTNSKQVITAIYIYVYLIRNEVKEDE